MRKQLILATAGVVLAVMSLIAQQGEPVKPVAASEAKKYIGTNAVVRGTVAEVHKTERVANINFGEKYPKHDFTAVVFARNFNVFTNLDELEGKTVEASGKVTEFRGKPQIILNSASQLRVIK